MSSKVVYLDSNELQWVTAAFPITHSCCPLSPAHTSKEEPSLSLKEDPWHQDSALAIWVFLVHIDLCRPLLPRPHFNVYSVQLAMNVPLTLLLKKRAPSFNKRSAIDQLLLDTKQYTFPPSTPLAHISIVLRVPLARDQRRENSWIHFPCGSTQRSVPWLWSTVFSKSKHF